MKEKQKVTAEDVMKLIGALVAIGVGLYLVFSA